MSFEAGFESGGSSGARIKNACETGDSIRPAVVMGCVEMVGVECSYTWEWEYG